MCLNSFPKITLLVRTVPQESGVVPRVGRDLMDFIKGPKQSFLADAVFSLYKKSQTIGRSWYV